MEKDDELKGEGNNYFTHFRLLDPRVGRWFTLDPIRRAEVSMYSAMSNNPIIMIDPNGDDDYYNENGKYLYTDNKTSTDIRLITQAQFNLIQNKYFFQMADRSHSYKGLDQALEKNSRIVKNKITSEHFKTIWKKTNMTTPLKFDKYSEDGKMLFDQESPNRRKEQAAFIVLDFKKAEIRLEFLDDVFNTANYSLVDIKSFKNNHPGLIILGNVHPHPFTFAEAKKFSVNLNLPYAAKEDDARFSTKNNIPVYQIQINGIGKQMPQPSKSPGFLSKSFDDVMDGKIDIGRDALETTGGKPTSSSNNESVSPSQVVNPRFF